jgi:hypothetical protein
MEGTMAQDRTAVRRALARWQAAGLLDAGTAARLAAEADAWSERARLSIVRLLLAVTATIVLVIAAGTFTAWLWPSLGVGARCALLAVLGVLLATFGGRVELGDRREPGWLLQTSGLVLVAIAVGYSMEEWPNGSTGGQVAGWLGALGAALALLFYLGRSTVMTVVALVMGYVFLVLLGVRAFRLEEGVLWLLDGLWLLQGAVVLWLLRRSPRPAWAAAAASALLYLLPLLGLLTMIGPLELDGATAAWPLDAWLIGITLLLLRLWRAEPDREVYALGLAVSVLLGVGFAFNTVLGALDGGPEPAALLVAAVGGLALWWAVPRREREVLLAGALALIIAAWYYAVERGEALSAFLALGFTAGLLFWVALRVGRRPAAGDEPPSADPAALATEQLTSRE